MKRLTDIAGIPMAREGSDVVGCHGPHGSSRSIREAKSYPKEMVSGSP